MRPDFFTTVTILIETFRILRFLSFVVTKRPQFSGFYICSGTTMKKESAGFLQNVYSSLGYNTVSQTTKPQSNEYL